MRKTLHIVDGRIFSSHFIFIRDGGALNDEALLSALGLSSYTPDATGSSEISSCRWVHILRGGGWSGVADDLFYTIYHDSGTNSRVAALAGQFELLRTAVGGCDYSCEFYHFAEGALRRGYDYRDWRPKPPTVFQDIGPRFLCEAQFVPGAPPDQFIKLLHDWFGIPVESMTRSITTYTTPYVRR